MMTVPTGLVERAEAAAGAISGGKYRAVIPARLTST